MAAAWERPFVATWLLLGGSEEEARAALGRAPLHSTDKDARARQVAAGLSSVLREIDAVREPPWHA